MNHDDLDSLASGEQARLQERVQSFQMEMAQQTQMQQAISDINKECFNMCIKDVSSAGGLTSTERKCVKQCSGRFLDSMQSMIAQFAKKQ